MGVISIISFALTCLFSLTLSFSHRGDYLIVLSSTPHSINNYTTERMEMNDVNDMVGVRGSEENLAEQILR